MKSRWKVKRLRMEMDLGLKMKKKIVDLLMRLIVSKIWNLKMEVNNRMKKKKQKIYKMLNKINIFMIMSPNYY